MAGSHGGAGVGAGATSCGQDDGRYLHPSRCPWAAPHPHPRDCKSQPVRLLEILQSPPSQQSWKLQYHVVRMSRYCWPSRGRLQAGEEGDAVRQGQSLGPRGSPGSRLPAPGSWLPAPSGSSGSSSPPSPCSRVTPHSSSLCLPCILPGKGHEWTPLALSKWLCYWCRKAQFAPQTGLRHSVAQAAHPCLRAGCSLQSSQCPQAALLPACSGFQTHLITAEPKGLETLFSNAISNVPTTGKNKTTHKPLAGSWKSFDVNETFRAPLHKSPCVLFLELQLWAQTTSPRSSGPRQ